MKTLRDKMTMAILLAQVVAMKTAPYRTTPASKHSKARAQRSYYRKHRRP